MLQSSTYRVLFIAGILLAVSTASQGCDCNKGSVRPPVGICSRDTTCAKGQEYRKGVCETARCDADRNGDSDCCPGQFCRFDGACVDQTKVCASDIDCNADKSGRTCQDRPEIADTKVCSFPLPTGDGLCPAGYQLFNKRCIRDLPCGGACEGPTSVCNIETNVCETVPQIPTTDANCDVSCGAGTIKVLSDPDGMSYHQCCAVACRCETLPPLKVGTYGKYTDGALASTVIVASSYNDTYGDLVVSTYDKTTGAQKSIEFVDGVPSSGTLAGDVGGPRKGIKEVGVNVGAGTSITVANDDQPRVVYYDVTNKDLKYAQKTASGWVIHTVDSAGDVGQYPNIEYIAGKLRVSYLVESGKRVPPAADDGKVYTMLRYAESLSLNPRAPADWAFKDIDAVEVRPVPCGGLCASGQVCVVVSGTDKCAVTAEDCTGTPGPGQVCVTPEGATSPGIFDKKFNSIAREYVEGMGLFSSMAASGADIYVSYYDNYTDNVTGTDGVYELQTGILKVARLAMDGGGAVTGSPQVFVVDGGKACGTADFHDVGRFSSIQVSPTGRIGIAYEETSANSGTLRFFQTSGTISGWDQGTDCIADGAHDSPSHRIVVVDDGVDPVESRVSLVGADASLIFDSLGKAQIAYQDQDLTKLRIASETAPGSNEFDVNLKLLDGVGPYGFFVHLLYDGAAAWIVNAHIGLDDLGNPDDVVIVIPTVLP